MIVACASRDDRSGANDPAATPQPQVGATAAAARIQTRNVCLLGNNKFAVHAIIPVHYSMSQLGELDTREFLTLECYFDGGACSGARLDLERADKGEPIGFMDFGTIDGAYLVDRTGDVFTVKWGGLKTFTIDFALGHISFTESAVGSEGRGQVVCNVGSS